MWQTTLVLIAASTVVGTSPRTSLADFDCDFDDGGNKCEWTWDNDDKFDPDYFDPADRYSPRPGQNGFYRMTAVDVKKYKELTNDPSYLKFQAPSVDASTSGEGK